MDNEQKDSIIMLDAELLATCLAENDWETESKQIKESELYETIKGKKEVKHYWAATFHLLREKYRQLIGAFEIKKSNVPYPATIQTTREKCINCGIELWYEHEVAAGLCPICSNKINNVIE